MMLVRPLVINFQQTVRADCCSCMYSLPQPGKSLAYRGWRRWELAFGQTSPPPPPFPCHGLLASKVKQTFLSTTLVSLLFFWMGSSQTPLCYNHSHPHAHSNQRIFFFLFGMTGFCTVFVSDSSSLGATDLTEILYGIYSK